MAERRDILFRLLGDSKSLQRATRQGQSALGRMSDSLKRVAGAAGLAFGGRELLRWTSDALQMAAAAEEVDSKFEAVFGTNQRLIQSLEDWASLAGITDSKAKDLAATFGNLAMAQGLSRDATEDLTVDVAELAGDLASFNNIEPDVVFNDLNKALLTTEREGMKKYGIAISEAEVKTRALAIATGDGRTEVTKADRALASYQIAVSQAGKAVGDLERTSDSTANTQRRLRARLEETQEAIGRNLLPTFKFWLDAVDDGTSIMDGFVDGLGLASEAVSRQEREVNKARWTQIVWDQATAGLTRTVREFNEAVEAANGGVRDLRDVSDDYAKGAAVQYPSSIAQMTKAQRDFNEAMAESEERTKTLADALQGDLFKAYRDARTEAQHLLEVQGLLAGGRDNPDYDRGEDYTTSSSIYNVNNGIS